MTKGRIEKLSDLIPSGKQIEDVFPRLLTLDILTVGHALETPQQHASVRVVLSDSRPEAEGYAVQLFLPTPESVDVIVGALLRHKRSAWPNAARRWSRKG